MIDLLQLRKHIAGKARHSANALLDCTLALMRMALPSGRLKVALTCLHVLVKALLWVEALMKLRNDLEEGEEEEIPP